MTIKQIIPLVCLMMWTSVTMPLKAQYKIPSDANIINVKRDFGAKGDGKHDDSQAIQRAITAALMEPDHYGKLKFVYFPTGTYLVSRTLRSRVDPNQWGKGWRAGLVLVGQDRRNTTIKLKNTAPGFGNPRSPKAVIMTRSETRKANFGENGAGNQAFRHSIISLTINTGRGNRGAIGIDYLANNRGAIENVDIVGEESGYCGISMMESWPGPCLLKKVSIYGFDYGIKLGKFQYGVTAEHLRLKDQRIVGILNDQNVLSIRKLRSQNQVPVIVSGDDVSHIILIDSEIKANGFISDTAISSPGHLLIRNTKVNGYQTVVAGTKYGGVMRGSERGNKIQEYVSHQPLSRYGNETKSLNLPIEETPTFNTQYFDRWANVNKYRKSSDPEGDDTNAIQRAIDSGKLIVYFPNGGYRISRPIIIRGDVKKLVGFQALISRTDDFQGNELIRFDGSSSDFTVLEHLRIRGKIVHNSTKTLSLRHLDHHGYANTSRGRGKLFIEDVMGRPYRIAHGQKVWGRQVNAETKHDPLISVRNSTLWLMGYKTEGTQTVLETTNGTTEVLGGLIYALDDTDRAAFITYHSDVSYAVTFNGPNFNKFYVRETRSGAMRTHRGVDRHSPMFISRRRKNSREVVADQQKPAATAAVPYDGFRVMPNPAQQQIHISVPMQQAKAMLKIRSIQGHTVFTRTVVRDQTLNVSHLAEGMYVAQLQQGNKLYTEKIIIER